MKDQGLKPPGDGTQTPGSSDVHLQWLGSSVAVDTNHGSIRRIAHCPACGVRGPLKTGASSSGQSRQPTLTSCLGGRSPRRRGTKHGGRSNRPPMTLSPPDAGHSYAEARNYGVSPLRCSRPSPTQGGMSDITLATVGSATKWFNLSRSRTVQATTGMPRLRASS